MTVKRYRTPRWFVLVFVVVVYATVNVAVPLALSTIGQRRGWDSGHPGPLNVIGLVLVVVGVVVLMWAAAGHTRAMRALEWRVFKVDPAHLLTPEYLVTDGPYRHTRNPLYVGDLTMWAGWLIFFASPALAVGFAVLFIGLQLGVRLEERGLARQFGDRWRVYASATPRFVSLRVRRG